MPKEAKYLDTFRTYVRTFLPNEKAKKLSIEHPLETCWQHLAQRMNRIPDSEKIVIEWIGLNLWIGFEPVIRFLKEVSLTHVELRILRMNEIESEIGVDLPKRIRKWSKDVPDSMEKIEDALQNKGGDLKAENRRFRVTIKKYPHFPHMHGFRLIEPENEAVTYLSFCGWKPPTYRDFGSGSEQFLIIDPNRPTEHESYILNLFDSAFRHYCNDENNPVLYDYDSLRLI